MGLDRDSSSLVVEPMMSLGDWSGVLNCSRRMVERLKSSGRLPKPDLIIGRMPRWKPETVRRWIESGGKGVS